MKILSHKNQIILLMLSIIPIFSFSCSKKGSVAVPKQPATQAPIGGNDYGVFEGQVPQNSSSDFYNYNNSSGDSSSSSGSSATTSGSGSGGEDTGGDNSSGQDNPDQYADQVRSCNTAGNIFRRTLGQCLPNLKYSTAYPCTFAGIKAEFAKYNLIISDNHLTGFAPDQCGFDLNNKPVAVLVKPDYTIERFFQVPS